MPRTCDCESAKTAVPLHPELKRIFYGRTKETKHHRLQWRFRQTDGSIYIRYGRGSSRLRGEHLLHDAIKQKQGRSFTGGNWLTKLFGFMMGGLKVTPTSRFNFLGAGPKIFRYLMRKNNVATLEELVEAAKALGINLYACEMAMHVLGLKKEDFIPEVKDVLGRHYEGALPDDLRQNQDRTFETPAG